MGILVPVSAVVVRAMDHLWAWPQLCYRLGRRLGYNAVGRGGRGRGIGGGGPKNNCKVGNEQNLFVPISFAHDLLGSSPKGGRHHRKGHGTTVRTARQLVSIWHVELGPLSHGGERDGGMEPTREAEKLEED
uniref:Uncharacterized protein n=1 Tax=Oryza punctata TaxID=4537 RepID=A0A0E0JWZ5_ORYPU